MTDCRQGSACDWNGTGAAIVGTYAGAMGTEVDEGAGVAGCDGGGNEGT